MKEAHTMAELSHPQSETVLAAFHAGLSTQILILSDTGTPIGAAQTVQSFGMRGGVERLRVFRLVFDCGKTNLFHELVAPQAQRAPFNIEVRMADRSDPVATFKHCWLEEMDAFRADGYIILNSARIQAESAKGE